MVQNQTESRIKYQAFFVIDLIIYDSWFWIVCVFWFNHFVCFDYKIRM